MDARGCGRTCPFSEAIGKWRHVPGGVDADGVVVTKPRELDEAELVCGLLERFGGYTLQTLMAESTDLLRLVRIEELGGSRDAERGDGQGHEQG